MNKLAIMLIVTLVCVAGLLCGCTDLSGAKVSHIGSLLDYADVGDEVIINGLWFDWGGTQQIGDDTGIIYVKFMDNVDTSELDKTMEYSFTGFIRYGEIPEHKNDMLYL
ncbi:MAG: hypothetical protein DRN27_09155, partial [Thermoplasmata archaeon]